MSSPRIASLAVASPPRVISQEEAAGALEARYGGTLSRRSLRVMRRLLSHPSIKSRRFAFEEPEEIMGEDPDRRVERFRRWAVELSAEAAGRALADAGLTAREVSTLVVNTCTGYVCPGISTYLVERLGLAASTVSFDLVGSGCGGAIPNLKMAGSLANGSGAVLSVSVEVCSATFQMEDDLSLILSNALFADGASAAVLWDRPEGLRVVGFASRLAPEHREAIRYVHKGGALHNKLSSSLPGLIRKPVARVVEAVLAPHTLSVQDIEHWAVHAGGERIIDAARDAIGLSEEQVAPSRRVLSEYGNMSSPTVLFVLREILDSGMKKGERCVMVSFGAGLSAHAALLENA
jgi:predicted naringenin-chalcone synthase